MRSPFSHEHHGHRHHRSGGFDDPRRGFGGGFGGPPPPPFPPDAEMPFPPNPWGRGRGGGRRGGPGHGPGGRQPRGNVRAAVLALLAERPMHGYEMIQEIGQRTDGVWRPSPGSVYPTLQMLADEGLVSATEEAGGKKLFTLTETGTAEAGKHEGATPWEQVNDEIDSVAAKLRTASRHLGSSMQQMAHAGTREQKNRAVEVLNEARRKIYAILGELDVEEDTDDSE
ncbi:PadR family transcriptional regulator [Umezawaea sp. Da 62-37]|uniref:PadR family transcriptional regulator n=1 Tax=Umezawaea sp. Da 62-37 TaxID=3075927 RepID=UPI0028F73A37|nr:PadR family transcriptional regulator [Umezawaea sp. Da 62-37]WNV89870.1 PadR family transcriptional regulator [Umezawaea sp. Da 62-37]